MDKEKLMFHKENITDLFESWDMIFDDLIEENFDYEHFKKIAVISMALVAQEINCENISKEVAILLMKMTRFVEREIYTHEQNVAHDVFNSILYDIEDGTFSVDDENCYYTYEPGTFSKTRKINMDTFDLSEFL